MKNRASIVFNLIITIILFSNTAHATWLTDNQYNFKIDIPSNWNRNSFIDGTDKVYDLTNPEGTIGIQIRCFEAEASVTAEMIAQLFDQGLVAEGATKLSYAQQNLNGLPGILAGYTNTFDGLEVGIITFSAISNGIGYLIFTVIPTTHYDLLMPITNEVLNTFTTLSDNFQQRQQITQHSNAGNGLTGLTGSTSQQNSNAFAGSSESASAQQSSSSLSGLTGHTSSSSSQSASSGENYVKIKGSAINGTFTFTKSDSYPLKNTNTVFVKGQDDQGNTVLEIVFYKHKGTGDFVYHSHNNNHLPGFVISNVNGQRVPGNLYNGTGNMDITEYHEGGRIKGYLNATLNGHDIEARFDLPFKQAF